VVESVSPEVDDGRFAVKRVVGEAVHVVAVVVTDGHDRLQVALQHRRTGDEAWRETPMEPLHSDRHRAAFTVDALGSFEYTVAAWLDVVATWREGLTRKVEAAVEVSSELLEGAALLREAAERARHADAADDAAWLDDRAARLETARAPADARHIDLALDPEVVRRARLHPDRSREARYPRVLRVQAERERARSGAWYEFFPRSSAPEPGRHGTLRDAEQRLPDVARLGFDVVYLPPIHPIGRTHRKGRENTLRAGPDDPGSPWAIGAQEGGHKSVHPDLGTLEDFDRFVASARSLELEIALDLALQCSPDHPYVQKHPDWFRHRPDGTIQYAENPPKKYQDIFPFDFECSSWRELWEELASIVFFWIDHGVRIFRVDNPHTKPFPFWEWLIAEVRRDHPDVVFLSEAFTRPAVMLHLAKLGFSQSYTYFTWRNTRSELERFFGDLASPPSSEVLRPNLFANTPDILPEALQTGNRACFQMRLVLAATAAGSYGIYGPPFELCVSEAVPGTEEYRRSEKYEVRSWDLEAPGHIRETVRALNEIRRASPALTRGGPPRFLPVDNDRLIAFERRDEESGDVVVVVVNLDPDHPQSGWLEFDPGTRTSTGDDAYQVEDLLGGSRHLWHGRHNYVSLDPTAMPAHVFRVRRRVRSEKDFDYYL